MLACARRDNFEIKAGTAPGLIVKSWVSETAAFIKTIDNNHLARAHRPGYVAPAHAWGTQPGG